jgi:hypothetical protein
MLTIIVEQHMNYEVDRAGMPAATAEPSLAEMSVCVKRLMRSPG